MQLIQQLAVMWNERRPELAAELYTDDYVGIDMTAQTRVQGPAGVTARLERIYRALPDLQFRAYETILENSQLALHWRICGAQRGVLLNIPPTGQKIQINGVSFLTLRDDKIQRAVHLWDMAAVLRTLGLLPELEQSAPFESSALQDALTMYG